MDRADHIIIGTGINALVAGAMLAGRGRKVVLLERENRAGGCMITQEITEPGFHHDVMAATFVLFLTSPAYGALGDDLARHGLEFCHSPTPTAVLRPGGEALVYQTDRAANIATLNALAAGDGDQHARDVGGIEADAEFLFALLGSELWSSRTARLLAKQAWKRGLNGLKGWFGQALQPARGWLESSYESPLAQALWAPWVLHTGLTPECATSAQMGKVIAFALEAAGAPVVKGGSGQAVAAFEGLIRERGGEILLEAEADEILVDGGKASGVRLADGREIHAPSVLASVAPGQLYKRLLRNHSASTEMRDPVRSYRHGRGNFQLHYALNASPRWTTPGLEDVALIHLTDGVNSVSRASNEALRGLLPAVPTICVGQPARLDPTRCPEGKAVLWLQIPDAPRVVMGDSAGTIATPPSQTWEEGVREAFADRIEAVLASHIENFAEIKSTRRAYSPADLEALNINLVGGDPYGGACAIDQSFVFRPFASSRNGATPLGGLLHIGASTHPGPGLGGGSGFNAAKRLGA